MKIVLADDEAFVRYGLKSMLLQRYPAAEIKEAGDGEVLLQIIEDFQPDFIFADIKMPKMSGLEAMERWADKSDAQWIILSGYSDFEYARKCIQYHVIDYLLKPVRFEEVECAIEKGEQFRRQKYMGRSQKARNDFVYFFNNRETAEIFAMDGNEKFGVVLCVDTVVYPINRTLEESVTEERLTDICRNMIGREVISFWIRRQQEEYILVCSTRERGNTICSRIKFCIEKLREELEKDCVTAYFTDICDTEEQLFAQLTQIENLKYFRFLYNYGKDASVKMLKDHLLYSSTETLVFAEKMGGFTGACRSGDYMQAVWAMHGIENMFSRAEIGEEQWKQLLSYLQTAFSSFDWDREKLIENLNHILKEMRPHAEPVKSAELILQIKTFIDENYHTSITVQWLAKKFHVTPNYLSALFKKETSMNIVRYVNQLRLKEGEYLLRTTNLSVKAISEKVGFSSTRYFTKLFVENYGCLPSDIRKK